jgi:hypothetical protein
MILMDLKAIAVEIAKLFWPIGPKLQYSNYEFSDARIEVFSLI